MDRQALWSILEPGVASVGFEIVELEFGGSASTLRLFIDGPDGVTIDDCARVSRQVSAILDVEDPIAGNYTLEVSSPGVDRPLVTPEHFVAAVGEMVRIETSVHLMGRRRFLGQLSEAGDTTIVVDVDGEPYELEYRQIDKAKLIADL